MPSERYYDGRHPTTGEPVAITGSRCICPTCRLVFSGESAFDRHRVGSHQLDERRCLSICEMASKDLFAKPSGVIGRRVRGPDAPGTAGPSSGPEAQAHGNHQSVPRGPEDMALPSDLHPPTVFKLSACVANGKFDERRDRS